MKASSRRQASRSLLRQAKAGQPRQKAKQASKGDLAAVGIGVKEVMSDG